MEKISGSPAVCDPDISALKISDLCPGLISPEITQNDDTHPEDITTTMENKDDYSDVSSNRGCLVDSGLELSSTAEVLNGYIQTVETQDSDPHHTERESQRESAVTQRRKEENTNNDAEDDDDVQGTYDASFRTSQWIFLKDEEDDEDSLDVISDNTSVNSAEPISDTIKEDPPQEEETTSPKTRTDSVSTTVSEVEYRHKRSYRELSIKKVQRKSSLQTFARENTTEISADKVITLDRHGSDEGLGFHIVGNHPTTISTVVPGSKADKAGIEIGDVILAINYSGVLHLNHQEIVHKLLQGDGQMTIELCRESSFTIMPHEQFSDGTEVFSSYMYKLTNAVLNIWKRRWFVLKSDNCLYYFKNKGDTEILGAIPLAGYMVNKAIDLKRPKDHALKLVHHTKTYYFAAMNEQELADWAQSLNEATSSQSTMDSWLDISAHNVGLPALSIRNVDCQGFIHKEGGNFKSWKRRYAVLKDGCLYYYCDIDSRSAQGVAHLHGYTVNDRPYSSKKNAFDLTPPEPRMRTFHFHAETEIDKERWIRAMKLSIGKWVKVS